MAPAAPAEGRRAELAAQADLARWSNVIPLPLVPVSAANLPDGTILLWSAEDRFGFGNDTGRTYTATFDPATETATERLVSETSHDMFCPGTANLPDGRILVNGGLSAPVTSLFDPATGVWSRGADMQIARAYQGTTPLADGSVFTLGGSWAGGVGNKHGELWTEAGGWRRLPGVPIDPFLSVDPTRNFGMDSHLWLIAAGNGRVFHAGPGMNVHWVETQGDGRVLPAGRRGDDEFSINGSAVLFDRGRVLKVGGGPGYDSVNANANAYVFEIEGGVSVRKIAPMVYRRAFHNVVVLPNGQVVVLGGATFAVGFSDNNSVLAPELFDPATETFVALPPMSVPRNYHSIALLLPDGRVLSGGGGLCGFNCPANHPDLQILSPPYLFNPDGTAATRPVIVSAPAQANHGTSIAVTTDAPVASFALVRAASTTHALNNDQRRLALAFRATGANAYAVDIPSNPGWALPGLYMLFALNEAGVPSVARTVRVGAASALRVLPIDDQSTARDAATALAPPVSNPAGAPLTFSATGLPPGLSIDPLTGAIAGAASSTGRYLVELSASDGAQTVSTSFSWTVNEPGTTRFVLFEARSEVAGGPWASAAELGLFDDNGEPLSRGGWAVTADSEAPGAGAAQAVDGDPATFWHTPSQGAAPAHPHHLRIDLKGAFRVAGFRYLPRQDASDGGTVADYRVYLSDDGVTWGAPVAEGDLSALGPMKAEKVVYFDNLALGKAASQSSTAPGAPAALAVDGGRDGAFASGSVSHTNADPNAYWEVDLGASYQTFGVRLWNRTDCCSDRLSNFYLLASDGPMAGRTLAELLADPAVSMVQVAGQAAPTQLFALSSRARYVRVQLGGTNFLHLAEVEVYGRLAANRAPALAPPAPGPLVIGAPASYALQATDPDGDPLTFSATGLPPGLSIDPVTGLITGTVFTGGSYPVVAQVDDGRGGSASQSFSWFVGLPPPTIGPVAAPLVSGGGAVTYQVTASGAGALEYQWDFGDGTGSTGFSPSNGVSHTFAGPGVYVVTVTVRNPDGSAAARQFLQAVAGPATAGRPRASGPIALETPAAGGPRLWVANPDNDSVSVFDVNALTKVAEIAVAEGPRGVSVAPDGRVWVAGAQASALSVISPQTLAVVQTVPLPRGARPHGVVHGADGSAYVALDALGRVLKVSGAGEPGASVEVGANPRELALTAAGDRLLVARFITGFQPGEATADVLPFVGPAPQGGAVLVVDPAAMAVTRAITLRHSDKPDTTVSGRGVPNYLGAPAVSPDGLSAWVPAKQDNVQRGLLRDGRNLDFQNTVRAISARVDLAAEAEDYPARVDHDNAGLASAALYHPSGAYLFVALETSRQIAVVDAAGKRELFRHDVGRAPQGLALADDGRTLFVHNFMDRTVSVVSLARLLDFGELALETTAALGSVASERLAPAVLRGKQLFYDARDTRLARDAYLSCAACHRDGGHDGRTWDFTGAGEGLRNTASLRGRGGSPGRRHWTGNFDEPQDFEAQIRALNQGTGLMADAALAVGTRAQPLGDPKAGLSADLDALAAYVDSLASADVSPHRTAAGALTAEAEAGRVVFAGQCAHCHGGGDFSDSGSLARHDVGTLKASSGARLGGPLTGFDTPALRDAWATAPYLHDGSAPTLEAAVSAHTNLSLSAAEVTSVAAFVRQLGPDEPALPPAAAPPGLTAHYFANRTLSGAPALTRLENIDFSWGQGAPAAGLPADDFSVRWAGQLIAPATGTYRLRTLSDDGIRVRVNGALVINRWTDHSPTTDTSAPLEFTAGQHVDLTVEYYERSGGAVAILSWLVPGATTYAVVPADRLTPSGDGLTGHYFANDALAGPPAATRTEGVDFSWADASPDPGLPADYFSARWTGQLLAPVTGTYRLRTLSDDGVRLWLNGSLLVDHWAAHPLTADVTPALGLVAGQRYELAVEYRELAGQAAMQLQWLAPGAADYAAVPTARLFAGGAGLRGQYYANDSLAGPPALTRVEAVDFDWGGDSPAAGLPADNFSARWVGKVRAPRAGAYRFQTLSDDGVRVWVNGALLVDNWTAHPPTVDTSATIELAAGQRYDVTVEYQEFGGGATMRLRWQTPGAPGFVAISKRELDGL
ncbi:MAG TPA: PA14 domain-containing protein [Polyangiaceae bacterium]|nr:PA14 domain-containing protein [Polyangiaceae bacterium]